MMANRITSAQPIEGRPAAGAGAPHASAASNKQRLPYADDDREQQPLELLAETAVEMVRRACKHGVATQMRAGLLGIGALDLQPAPATPDDDLLLRLVNLRAYVAQHRATTDTARRERDAHLATIAELIRATKGDSA